MPMDKDIASREAILAITEDIAHYLLNIDIKEVEFVDKELKRIEKREADIVAKCKINNQTQILHLEIQNNNGNTMPRRMFRYYTGIKIEFKDLNINQHLIYIDKAKLNMANTIYKK
ncbi:5-methyltetrahydrofolate:corrinoid iron-sulfur protein methyltransferase [hydrothermal vent metagenome]|uniref:5-methyltetrahydrofolate:corrinoid iron-sulfur protein methyltransferase n=1 Tax=hydrothermal vent metagenome TaxID=652676 RepID=A0A1W1E578_9ZZZZ